MAAIVGTAWRERCVAWASSGIAVAQGLRVFFPGEGISRAAWRPEPRHLVKPPSFCFLVCNVDVALREYKVVGRCLPTPKCHTPPLYRMRIFAPNHVVAKSRFWYFVSQLKKMKKSSGEIVYCGQVFEKSPLRVKNFGIWLRYDSRSGTHNMYREYRDLTTAGAVTQCYRDMGARHRARAHSIQIMKVEEIAASKCRRPAVKQFHDSKIKFPLPHRVLRRQHKPRFTTKRPNTFF
ncbi:PREDICTED: 60S ribosomal protein L18a isoform X1 [Mandrillus leucophaeus]|uniref:Large ribosomal subunit protein eL20 n=2 Tax=Boreoeutheria TaxID=1437010 RepID=A0A2K5XKI9_MANLE|nr:PREDICTED: 60S ribosomal protein L18a isoform X1 [Mandrillus leucophaeus]